MVCYLVFVVCLEGIHLVWLLCLRVFERGGVLNVSWTLAKVLEIKDSKDELMCVVVLL